MRWRFLTERDLLEWQEKQTALFAADNLWSKFLAVYESIEAAFAAGERPSMEVIQEIASLIFAIHRDLAWEIGLGPDGRFNFIITTEMSYELQALCDAVIERHPPLPSWDFLSYRQPVPVHTLRSGCLSRLGRELPEQLEFKLVPLELNSFELLMRSSEYEGEESEGSLWEAFLIASLVLGEEDLEKWVSFVQTCRYVSSPSLLKKAVIAGEWFKPEQFREHFLAEKQKMLSRLPAQPLSQLLDLDSSARTMIQGTADDQESNRLTISTMVPKAIMAYLKFPAFYSERFTATGERFCYIKISAYVPMEDRLDNRYLLETRLDELLRGHEMGLVVGSGFSDGFDFIDLAISRLDMAVPALREFFEEIPEIEQGWLLFCDELFEDEWVPLTSKTSSPVAMS